MQPKRQIRIIGIDDVPHKKSQKEPVLVIGAIFRGADYLDNVLSTEVKLDGSDATEKLIAMINKSRSKAQLRVIMLDGIALGGFNVVDIHELSKRTGLPVIVVTRDKPNMASIKRALKNFSDKGKKWSLIQKAGKVNIVDVKPGVLQKPTRIYFQFAGTTIETVLQILQLTIKHGALPEPVRIAHIIGQGISTGESKGRA